METCKPFQSNSIEHMTSFIFCMQSITRILYAKRSTRYERMRHDKHTSFGYLFGKRCLRGMYRYAKVHVCRANRPGYYIWKISRMWGTLDMPVFVNRMVSIICATPLNDNRKHLDSKRRLQRFARQCTLLNVRKLVRFVLSYFAIEYWILRQDRGRDEFDCDKVKGSSFH